MTKHSYFSRDGRPCDESEALDERGVIKSGYGIRSAVFARDHAVQIADNGQQAWERRLSDAWKGETHNAPPRPPVAKFVGDHANGQAAYERRISDAWKGHPHV